MSGSNGGGSQQKRTRCQICTACTTPNCGECVFCKDMTKFGGEGTQKQCCLNTLVRAALLNVNSMEKKTSKISELITENQLAVLFTTETRLKSGLKSDMVLREASPPNFNFFYHVSEVTGRRGVAVQFSTLVLEGEQIQFQNTNTFEYVVAVLKHTEWEEPVLSINLYRPSEKTSQNLSTITNFLDEFQKLWDQVHEKYNNIIVTGDFNIWVDYDWMAYVTEFNKFLSCNDLDRHPNKPTFRRSSHILDLVLSRNVEVSDVEVKDNNISDHKTVYFKLKPKRRR
ncbi:hypothetical protein KUCAC02_036640 [Chaenocephalus aceratus]|nr:hypothetical protein KUCAC02_036640 [Chaenocephalus aceratus]